MANQVVNSGSTDLAGGPTDAQGGPAPLSLLFEAQARRLALANRHGDALALLEGLPDASVDGRIRLLRGKILVQSGDLDGARAEFEAARRLAPDDPDALAAHELAERLGRGEGASVPRNGRLVLGLLATILALGLLGAAGWLGVRWGHAQAPARQDAAAVTTDPRITEILGGLEDKIDAQKGSLDSLLSSDAARHEETGRIRDELHQSNGEQGEVLARQDEKLAALGTSIDRLSRQIDEVAARERNQAAPATDTTGELSTLLERHAGEIEILSARLVQVESEVARSREQTGADLDEIQRSLERIRATLAEQPASRERRPRKPGSDGDSSAGAGGQPHEGE